MRAGAAEWGTIEKTEKIVR